MIHVKMSKPNIYEERFRVVAESTERERNTHKKIIKGVIELNSAQKNLRLRQRELADAEVEITVLKSKNREIKVLMMKALIERDELLARRTAVESNIERLSNQLKNMGRETDDLLKGDEVDHICERFALSEQISLLNRLQDNRSRLLKNGFPLNFLA